jgi:uncharacterized membrane protein HdeD (DUF308 family)
MRRACAGALTATRIGIQGQGDLMITLGIILLIIGIIAKISILYVIGGILLVVGLILLILGSLGRAVGGRRHYF